LKKIFQKQLIVSRYSPYPPNIITIFDDGHQRQVSWNKTLIDLPWSPDNHRLFPKEIRTAVKEIFMLMKLRLKFPNDMICEVINSFIFENLNMIQRNSIELTVYYNEPDVKQNASLKNIVNKIIFELLNSSSSYGILYDKNDPSASQSDDNPIYPSGACLIHCPKKITKKCLEKILYNSEYIYNPCHYLDDDDDYNNSYYCCDRDEDEFYDSDYITNNDKWERLRKITKEKHFVEQRDQRDPICNISSLPHLDEEALIGICDDCGRTGTLICVSACDIYDLTKQKCCYKYVCQDRCVYECPNHHSVKISHKEITKIITCSMCNEKFERYTRTDSIGPFGTTDRSFIWNYGCFHDELNVRNMEDERVYPGSCDICHQNGFLYKRIVCSKDKDKKCHIKYFCKICV
jgi:hypothetical protein